MNLTQLPEWQALARHRLEIGERHMRDFFAEDADRFLAGRLEGENACWHVAARSWYFDPEGHLPLALARAGHLRRTGKFDGVAIYRWERTSPAKDDHGP